MPRKSGPQFSRKLDDMQNSYETPEMEIVELENRDVIVSSTDVSGDSGTDNF